MDGLNKNPNSGVNPLKPTAQAPSTTTTTAAAKSSFQAELEKKEGLKDRYEEKRIITIALISDLAIKSVYRQVNAVSIPDRNDTIGSSVLSGRRLMSSVNEINKYMPAILGISPSHPDFITRVSKWFGNISLKIPTGGYELNCNFDWDTKEDYLKYKIEEEKIEAIYDEADKTTPKLLKEAIRKRVDSLTSLEATRALHGMPQNVEHYFTYRHCLLYPHVAKDTAVIHFDQSVRFYIKDEQKDLYRVKKRQQAANIAKRNYLDILDDSKKFRNVFVCYCASTGNNILVSLGLEDEVKQNMLDTYSMQEPEKFNKLFNNRNIGLQALIEEAVAKGELLRSDINQNIITPEGNFIGGNMKEAISYLLNPQNEDFKKLLETKIKL